jgi:hypothetical protein
MCVWAGGDGATSTRLWVWTGASPQSRLAALRRHCGANKSIRSPSDKILFTPYSLLITSYSLLPYSLLFTSCTGGKPCGRKSLRPYSPSAPRLRRHRQLTLYFLLFTSLLLTLYFLHRGQAMRAQKFAPLLTVSTPPTAEPPLPTLYLLPLISYLLPLGEHRSP